MKNETSGKLLLQVSNQFFSTTLFTDDVTMKCYLLPTIENNNLEIKHNYRNKIK